VRVQIDVAGRLGGLQAVGGFGGLGEHLEKAVARLLGEPARDLQSVFDVERLEEVVQQRWRAGLDGEELLRRIGGEQQIHGGLHLIFGDQLLEGGDQVVAADAGHGHTSVSVFGHDGPKSGTGIPDTNRVAVLCWKRAPGSPGAEAWHQAAQSPGRRYPGSPMCRRRSPAGSLA
jgi:hypothetical protein